MNREYLDFDIAIRREGGGYAAHVVTSPAGAASAPFALPFGPTELAQFMLAVGPPRVTSRRLVRVAERVPEVRDYGMRLGDALLSGPVGAAFRDSHSAAASQGKSLRVGLRLDQVPELDDIPWEYVYDRRLERFLTLSSETPVVRLLDSLEQPPVITVEPPLRVLVMISSPADLPELAVARERTLLETVTKDMVEVGTLEIVVMEGARWGDLQKALIDRFNVFHFIGHGGFDETAQEGVLAFQNEDGTADRVSATRLGTILHDARDLQLAVLNACEGARSSGGNAFSGVGQALVRQGLPAVVAMQTEISDQAALKFTHEFYFYLTKGLGIDAAMCEVRKAMATADEASEWGTAVLLRSGSTEPFDFVSGPGHSRDPRVGRDVDDPGRSGEHDRTGLWDSLYTGAMAAIANRAPSTALPMLEQLAVERPDYRDVTHLLEQVRPAAQDESTASGQHPGTGGGAATLTLTDRPPVVRQPQPTTSRRRTGAGWIRQLFSLVVLVALVGGGLWWWNNGLAVMVRCGLTQAATGAASQSFTFGCATTAPTIDGDFDDWAQAGPAVTVKAPVAVAKGQTFSPGLTAAWQGQWNSDALFLHVRVNDPSLRSVDVATPARWWEGDGFSFELGPDNRGLSSAAGPRRGDDIHVLVGLVPTGAEAAFNRAANATFTAGGLLTEARVARKDFAGGYEIEASFPWTSLEMTQAPQRGTVLAMNLNVSDAVPPPAGWGFRSMISSNPGRGVANQKRPATWQRLLVADTPRG